MTERHERSARRARLSAAAPGPTVPARPKGEREDWRSGRNRVEKSELIRDALLHAAAEVVGEVGYANASIALITRKAGVALGTFYNYFASRQDILDALLPSLGAQMRAHVRERARVGRDFHEREELSFRSFFSFLKETPYFFRILNEAESFAPKAHEEHIKAVAEGYLSFLSHARTEGEISDYSPEELEVVVFILMAARSYLALRFARTEAGDSDLPEWVVHAYMKFALYGLQGMPVGGARTGTASAKPKPTGTPVRKTSKRKWHDELQAYR